MTSCLPHLLPHLPIIIQCIFKLRAQRSPCIAGVCPTGENSVWTSNQVSSHPLHSLYWLCRLGGHSVTSLGSLLLRLIFPLLPVFLAANPRGPYRHPYLTRQCPRATAHPALSQPANGRQRLRPLSAQRVFSACSYPTQLKRNENVLVVMTLADAASTEVTKL